MEYSVDIICQDNSLRSLYQLAFNSRSISKALINNLNIIKICGKIITLIDNDDISVKTSASLLVGICKVYNKGIKIYLDELISNKNDETDPKIKSKKINKKELETTNVSLGKEGLFNILKERQNKTPSKLVEKNMIETPDSIEVFRAQASIANEKFKSDFIGNEESGNFLNFITENVDKDLVEHSNIKFDLDMDFTYSGKKLKFSETKSLLDNFKIISELSNFKEKRPKEFIPKIEFDMNIELVPITNESEHDSDNDTIEDDYSHLMNKYKKNILLNSNPFIKLELNKLIEEEDSYIENLSKNLNLLDFKEFSDYTDLNSRLNKLIEEEKENINEPVTNEIINNNDTLDNLNYVDNENQIHDIVDENINDTIISVINKKKKTNFKQIIKNMKNYNESDVFYSLLCVAQNHEYNLFQKKIFGDITIE